MQFSLFYVIIIQTFDCISKYDMHIMTYLMIYVFQYQRIEVYRGVSQLRHYRM